MMKKILPLLILLLLAGPAWGFRCGIYLIREGDYKYLVEQRCGEPISRDFSGYTLTPDGQRELTIERWVYGPDNGYYYILTFEGGILERIDAQRK